LKKYNILYCDPNWSYDNSVSNGAAVNHYPVLKTEELKKLPIQVLCADICYLFLWATPPMLPEALETMKAWGFEYKTNAFTWIKLNKDGTVFKGTGNYTRANTELCLLGRRGPRTLPRNSKSVASVVIEERGKHSAKPKEVAERIVDMLGDVPRIELFARDKKPGWDATGLELDGRDIRDVLAVGGLEDA